MSVYERRIDEQVVPGRRLGRHVRHDPRSLAYLAPEADPATLTSVRHVRRIPVLDQGSLGSCTGNAAEGCLGTSPFWETLPSWFTGMTADADEKQAIDLYSVATGMDDYPGEFPPDDTGSDGLSVAKACASFSLISGYRHATSLNAALTALADRPVIVGIEWWSSFDEPEQDGTIRIEPDAYVRGGHEVVLDELDVEHKTVWLTNSWGEGWGLEGRACMSWDTLGRLLDDDGDCTVFVPLYEPAPTPTPPAPLDPLAELVDIIKGWFRSFEDWFRRHGGQS